MPEKQGHDRQIWRGLLRSALHVVDSLEQNGYGTLDFRLGGGTVLMFRFDHRISNDIDLFVDDAQALSFVSPRLNDIAAQQASHYQEQSNVVKLVLPAGDIDFIVAGTVVRDAHGTTLDFEGRAIPLEATAEILAKKIQFRAESFKARDVFDMVAALSLDRPAVMDAIAATRHVHDALRRRLEALAKISPVELLQGIVFTDTGLLHADDMINRLIHAIQA